MFIRIILLLILALALLQMACTEDDENGIVTTLDTIPPAAVTTLGTSDPTGSSITLNWISVGDDEYVGRARVYDIRYSTGTINESNFEQATQALPTPYPRVVGYDETFIVSDLDPETFYYFAIKVADDAINWSGISNIVSSKTHIAGDWIVFNTENSDLLSNKIMDIAFLNSNRYYGTGEGLGHFDGESWTIYTHDDVDNNTIIGNQVNHISIDDIGRLWLGTVVSGVSLFDGVNFTNFNDTTSDLTSNSIRGLQVDNSGNVWIGTSSHGLFKYDNSNWTVYNNSNSNIGSRFISTVNVDNDNNVWIGFSFGGASKYDGVTFTNYDASNGLPSNAVWAIDFDENNNIWFGTENGVAVFDGTSSWTIYNMTNSNIIDNVVISLSVGQNYKWIGTRYGLNRFDGTNWKTITTFNSQLPDNFINVITVDQLGIIYLGTDNGIGIYSNY